jgi:hypothetical protein
MVRSDVLDCLAGFVAPASEPGWSEWGELASSGLQLVCYVTREKAAYASPSAFWVSALFNFLEDRDDDGRLEAVAKESLCREVDWSDFVEALTLRRGEPLAGDAFPTSLATSHEPGRRVHLMLDAEDCWAALLETEDRYVAVFSARSSSA